MLSQKLDPEQFFIGEKRGKLALQDCFNRIRDFILYINSDIVNRSHVSFDLQKSKPDQMRLMQWCKNAKDHISLTHKEYSLHNAKQYKNVCDLIHDIKRSLNRINR